MQIAKFMDAAKVPALLDHDDQPISGGVASVMARGYPAQLARLGVDHLILGASPEELQRMAAEWGIPQSIVERRSRVLAGHAARQIAAQKKGA